MQGQLEELCGSQNWNGELDEMGHVKKGGQRKQMLVFYGLQSLAHDGWRVHPQAESTEVSV